MRTLVVAPSLLLSPVILMLFAACSQSSSSGSAPVSGIDAGGPRVDSGGATAIDATAPPRDSGPVPILPGGGPEAGVSDASLHNDGAPAIDASVCLSADAGPPIFPQKCITQTANECDGPTDTALAALGIPSSLRNGKTGNGLDDDCDGLVDEGCSCASNGQTKPCFLVPPSQIDPSTNAPVGWCATNSRGSLDCAGGEFPTWSGTCRGASPPYANDVCAPGDYNCDGVQENNALTSCACSNSPVQCPTTAITEQPYPDPAAVPLIDGSQWILSAADRAMATNWTWTVIGGDCDNVLPHPTFGLYSQTNSTGATLKGVATPVVYSATATPPRYVASSGQPLISIQAQSYGNGVAGGQVYPAFALSGDYIAQGEWDLKGTHYVCTQKVQVRGPGIRAELCWDTVGGAETSNAAGNDIDLHFARLQGAKCSAWGWDSTCQDGDNYYGNPEAAWGYAASPNSACIGWGSRNTTGSCANPRLDQDNVTCDKTVSDPTNTTSFCNPENTNLDNPNNGDAFLVGVNHFGNYGGTNNAHPHVDLYCNGERVLSAGYNPLTGQKTFPLLNTPGDDSTGDIWSVATITAHVDGGVLTSCDVVTIPSHHADQTRDGVTNPTTNGNQICVDSTSTAAPVPYKNHNFVEPTSAQSGAAGSLPSAAAGFCKH